MHEVCIADFEILRKLGQGSYSSVYKVRRKSDGQEYAMKKVQMNGLSIKEKQNALNEVRILASLSNFHIIGYREAFIKGETLFLILEFAGGGDLQQKIEYTKKKGLGFYFDEQLIWIYLIEMLLGLQELHNNGIYHRDIKCANVFLTQDHKHIKLGDLNVAKIVKSNQLANTKAGTPYYASPEVWKDEPYDQKCDIWSLGCVIYEMAQLQPPFLANDLYHLQKKVQRGIYEPLNQRYSKELSYLISRCLQVSPKTRASCEDLLNLEEIKKRQLYNDSGALLNNGSKLLGTIYLPRNYKDITLPRPRYQTDNSDASLTLNKRPSSRVQRTKSNNISNDSDSPSFKKIKIKNKLSNNLNIPSLQRSISQNNSQLKENIPNSSNIYQLQPLHHQHHPSHQGYQSNNAGQCTPRLRKQLSSPQQQKQKLQQILQQDFYLPRLEQKQLNKHQKINSKCYISDIRKLL
ncbi:unnamed protein product [Paramecium sonneborni]|uniref:non-specific serine/threonine protein kinase n=1 Tax=Paramecium sonneborni TaxID=65129 RepID=A0A8S1MP37_9CILI|nr:unnamed protein product [Paramecium sonneborni]